jgi:hypothetical protein
MKSIKVNSIKIKSKNKPKNKTAKNKLITTLPAKICDESVSLFVIDYANVIYTLSEKFKNFDQVVLHFYSFLCKQLKLHSIVYIVCKLVVIDNNRYDIQTVLSRGESLSRVKIPEKYFKTNQLNIIHLEYPVKISSSIDDVAFWYISTKIWFEVCNSPRRNMYLVTNDKQHFDKNLFGETNDERNHDISISRDLKVKTVDPKNGYAYKSLKEFAHVPREFAALVDTVSEDNSHLECKVSLLVELLMNKPKLYGTPNNNPNFKGINFTKKMFPKSRFKDLNSSYRNASTTNKRLIQKCNLKRQHREKKDHSLKSNDYLYALVKYMQLYIYKNKKHNENFYGSMDKKNIIKLFSSK